MLGDLKTKCSRRKIHLTARAADSLSAHQKRQLEERMRYMGHGGSGARIHHSNRDPANPSNLINRSFRLLLERARLPRIRFHDLPYTAATLLLKEDTHPEHTQELLGHANISQTMDPYSHVLPGIGNY